VREAQQALKDKGYDVGAVDGVMGTKTQSGIRSFQQAQGIEQSGTLDQKTLAALGSQGSSSSTASQPSTSRQGTSTQQ
jgi:peptidoglycan hydrolase-like protein with peptidoglycan-binding domain